jgi:undecaprenyl pyrophosphate phosphatase UppP
MNRLTLKESQKKLVSLLKVISPVVMVSAIALELWNLEARLTTNQFPSSLMSVLWLGHLAISVHLIEAVVAALNAPAKKHKPIQYGIYTFFVGTVGLWELFESDTKTSD